MKTKTQAGSVTEMKNRSNLVATGQHKLPSAARTAAWSAKPQTDGATHLGHNFGAITIQPKLTIGPVNDQYEQEADQVAQQVVNQIDAPITQRQSLPEDEEEALQPKLVQGAIQRQEAPEDEEEALQAKAVAGTLQREELPEDEEEMVQTKPLLQRSADGSMAATPELEATIQQARGSGQPLPAAARQPMEHAFGADFSRVKVHADAQADQLNRSIQARAFTTGQDIFMRQGEYTPHNRSGQALLAHELTHVVQQNQDVTR